jgi:NAD(P)-dependent dehydrogenase (short-subunit alcohol dehydrogenase family)
MARLAGRVALITGAGRGIGRAIALRYASEGCSLALSDLDLAGADETAYLCREAGAAHNVRISTTIANVTKRADVEAMVATCVADLGRLDIVVNNAGIFNNAAFELMTDDQWMTMMDVNLNSVFLVSQVAVRHWLAEGKPGVFVNLASVSATVSFTESSHYCTAKAGVEMLTRCIAMELGPMGIRANSMAPGIIATEMTRPALSEPELAADWMRRIPSRRYGTPEDVADLALFLASDESRYINGEMIYVDGGATWAWSKPGDDARYPRTYPFPA